MVKKIAVISFWTLLSLSVIGLLVVSAGIKRAQLCKGVNIEVAENSSQVFTDLTGVKIEVEANGGKSGVPINSINLQKIESGLEQNPWIENAKLYFDHDGILQVYVDERSPVARVFTLSGNSFFIDSSARYLPVSRNSIARVPVFTGFPSDRRKLSAPDSMVLQSVKTLANFIISDSLWNAYVAQVNIKNGQFQIMPVAGDAVINIGNAEDLPAKFDRLYSFYKQVLSRTGLNKYKVIDVQYKGQVVASTVLPESNPVVRIGNADSTVISKPVKQIKAAEVKSKTIVYNTTKNNRK